MGLIVLFVMLKIFESLLLSQAWWFMLVMQALGRSETGGQSQVQC